MPEKTIHNHNLVDKLIRIVTSRLYITIGIVLMLLLIMPSNSPVPIPSDYKVIPAVLAIVALSQIWLFKDKEDK